MRIELKIFGKQVILLQTGDPPNLAPDFTSERIGFTLDPQPPREFTLPERD